MKNKFKQTFVATILCLVALAGSAAATTVQQDRAEMDRQIAEVAGLCRIDITAPGAKKAVSNSPAFFWYTSYVSMNGELLATQKEALRPAFRCHRNAPISVDETLAKAALDSTKTPM